MPIATVHSARVRAELIVLQQLAGDLGAAGELVVSRSVDPGGQFYTPTGSPPALYYPDLTVTIPAGGTYQLDFLALPGLQDAIDARNLKVQVFHVRGRAANAAGDLTIDGTIANGYAMFGSGVAPKFPARNSRSWLLQFDDLLPDVNSSTAHLLNLVATEGDVFYVDMLVG